MLHHRNLVNKASVRVMKEIMYVCYTYHHLEENIVNLMKGIWHAVLRKKNKYKKVILKYKHVNLKASIIIGLIM